ncbi:MAG: hypothetical protein WBO08_05375 [Mycobacterium sp.]
MALVYQLTRLKEVHLSSATGGVDRTAFYGNRPYAHLRTEFEDRLQKLQNCNTRGKQHCEPGIRIGRAQTRHEPQGDRAKR